MFSVVTVVLNRQDHIRRAVESVLSQNYPSFEHIVIDGGSTDGTLQIIQEYPHLKWISEPDEGAVFAMNKGLAMLSGDVFAWLNSDETYRPGTFHTVTNYFRNHPDWAMIYGRYQFVDATGVIVGCTRRHKTTLKRQILGFNPIAPSAMFLRRSAVEGVGGRFNPRWQHAFDHELWIRVLQRYQVVDVPEVLSCFGLHPDSGLVKNPTFADKETAEIRAIYGGERRLIDRLFWVPYFNCWRWLFRQLKWRLLLQRASSSARQEKLVTECRVCSSASIRPMYISGRQAVSVWRCDECGSKIVANQFDRSELESVYEEAKEYYEMEAPVHETLLMEWARVIATMVESSPSRTLLDVGAGTGIFLDAARKQGFEVHGLEFADRPIAIARQRYGIELSKRTLSQEQATYDVVTAFRVLEHVDSPKTFAADTARVLRTGGILALYTPIYGWFDRLAWWAYRLSGRKLTHLLDWRNSRAHLSIVTERGLRALLKEQRLTVLSMRRVCEYNQPIANYFFYAGLRHPWLLQACTAVMGYLVKRNMFFRNNVIVYCRKEEA